MDHNGNDDVIVPSSPIYTPLPVAPSAEGQHLHPRALTMSMLMLPWRRRPP
jgi:hypothetical protein